MNSKEVLLLKEAKQDLENGKKFYDEIEEAVGDYFWDSLLSDIESLIIYAGVHSKKFGSYRMLSKRFPYAIYYELKNDISYVIAVLPMKRDPDWIKSKLQGRNPIGN